MNDTRILNASTIEGLRAPSFGIPDSVLDSHEALRARLAEAVELLRASTRSHKYVEDCWYSCPKAEDGCCDERQGDDCNCGADEWNERVRVFIEEQTT